MSRRSPAKTQPVEHASSQADYCPCPFLIITRNPDSGPDNLVPSPFSKCLSIAGFTSLSLVEVTGILAGELSNSSCLSDEIYWIV